MGEGGNELEVGGIVDDINRNWSAVLMVETSETAGEKQSIWEVTAKISLNAATATASFACLTGSHLPMISLAILLPKITNPPTIPPTSSSLPPSPNYPTLIFLL